MHYAQCCQTVIFVAAQSRSRPTRKVARQCASRAPWVGKVTRVRRTNQANDLGSVFDLNRQTNRAAAVARREIRSVRDRLPTYLVQCNCRGLRAAALTQTV